MNLHITEQWLRERAEGERGFSPSAGIARPLGEQIQEARAAQEGTAVAPTSVETSTGVVLTVVQKRHELKSFMASSAQTFAIAARNFEQMTDNDVEIMYEQVELLKRMAAGAAR